MLPTKVRKKFLWFRVRVLRLQEGLRGKQRQRIRVPVAAAGDGLGLWWNKEDDQGWEIEKGVLVDGPQPMYSRVCGAPFAPPKLVYRGPHCEGHKWDVIVPGGLDLARPTQICPTVADTDIFMEGRFYAPPCSARTGAAHPRHGVWAGPVSFFRIFFFPFSFLFLRYLEFELF
jgi:hypothetical protein